MSNTSKKVVAIVVTYNGASWIEKCFSSVLQSSIPVHVIAIDNASTDDTVPAIQRDFPQIELIASKVNLGFGKANNIGLKKALALQADFIFLLNQDAWVDKNCIEKLTILLLTYPGIHLLSPYHLNYNTNGTEEYFNDFVLKQYTPGYAHPGTKEIYETSFVHAAGWMLPIATVTTVGGFDPLFEHTGEDNDYIQRLHYLGLKAGLTTLAVMYHQGTNEGLLNPAFNYRLKLNTALLKLKNPHATGTGAWLLWGKNSFSAIAKMISCGNVKCLKSEIKLFCEISQMSRRIRKARVQQHQKGAFI